MIEKKCVIQNKLGLHARAAAKLVACTSRFGCEVQIFKDSQHVNGKSIMGVMMLAAPLGCELVFHINGEDEQDAALGIEELINNRFGESE